MRFLVFLVIVLFSIQTMAQSVYSTPSGEKYHTSTCRYVKNVAHKMSESEAKKKGLTACKQCKPGSISNSNALASRSNQVLGLNSNEAKGQNSKSTQCLGKTKEGKRCKKMTKNVNGFCHLHER